MTIRNVITWPFNDALSAVSKETNRRLKRQVGEYVEWKELIIFVVIHSTVSRVEWNKCE